MYLFCDKVEEFFLDVDCEDMRYPYPVKAIVKTYPGLIAKRFDIFWLNNVEVWTQHWLADSISAQEDGFLSPHEKKLILIHPVLVPIMNCRV